jgi:ribosomal-protein-alanine N-acetyltransferase
LNLNALESFPRLETKRLVLDQLVKENVEQLLEINSFNDRAKTEEELDQLLRTIAKQQNEKQGVIWALYLDKEVIGTLGYYRGFENKEGEVGYVIREKYRRQGFLTEALTEVVRFGFEQLELNSISAYTTDYNHASVLALEKFGFIKTETHSGLRRKWVIFEIKNDFIELFVS